MVCNLSMMCLICISYELLVFSVRGGLQFLNCLHSQRIYEYAQITIISEDCQKGELYWISEPSTMSFSCASLSQLKLNSRPWNENDAEIVVLSTSENFYIESYWTDVLSLLFPKNIKKYSVIIIIVTVTGDELSNDYIFTEWISNIESLIEKNKIVFSDLFISFECDYSNSDRRNCIIENWELYYMKYGIISQNTGNNNTKDLVTTTNNYSDSQCNGYHILLENIQYKLQRRQDWRHLHLRAHVLMTSESVSENNVTEVNGELILNSGLSAHILQDMMHTLNFTIGYSIGSEIKRWADGTLRGNTAEALLNGDLDIFISHTTLLPYRALYIRFLQPTTRSRIEAVFIQPSAGTARNIYTGTFNLSIWICIGVICTGIGLSMRLIWWCATQNDQMANTLLDEDVLIQNETCIWGLGLLLQQGWYFSPVFIPLRIVFIVGYLFGLVCYVAYCAAIVSTLAIPVVPIKTFTELLDSDLKAFVPNDSTTMTYFLDGLAKRRNDPNVASSASMEDALLKIGNHEPYSLIGLTFYIFRVVRNLQFDESWVCSHITVIPASEDLVFSAMIVPKNSPFAEIFNYKIIRLKELGLLFRYVAHYNLGVYIKCLPKPSTHEKLGINDVYTAFLIIIFGLCLSVSALFLELAWFNVIGFRKNVHKITATFSAPKTSNNFGYIG